MAWLALPPLLTFITKISPFFCRACAAAGRVSQAALAALGILSWAPVDATIYAELKSQLADDARTTTQDRDLSDDEIEALRALGYIE